MYNQMITQYTPNAQAPIPHHQPTPPHWTTFFNPNQAVAELFRHVSSRTSAPTKNTLSSYQTSLAMYNKFAGDKLPTPELIRAYIYHLQHIRKMSVSSIMVRLAPVRIYLRALSEQPTIGYRGHDRDLITEYREQIRSASEVKNPPPTSKSNYGPLFNPEFVRLEQNQVNLVLLKIDRYSLQGKRDYALLITAFYTALRITELTRITLNGITPLGDGYTVTVRGKRGIIDPVPLSKFAHMAIMEYVTAYNQAIQKIRDETDNGHYTSSSIPPLHAMGRGLGGGVIPPMIEGDVPLWQPIESDNSPMRVGRGIGTGFYDPCVGLLQKGIRGIIGNRTAFALGDRFRLAAHDTRRTAAYIAYKGGMPLPAIQKLLRHKDASTTLKYIGASPDFQASDMAQYGIVFGYAA
ncbi:MAG: tyrosine-type recombinase/integrase [bacterium]|nr:tyrosine-type recombinase/integrase [bacterium]